MLPGTKSESTRAVFAVARVLSLFLMELHCVIHVMLAFYFILNIKAFMLLACSIHYNTKYCSMQIKVWNNYLKKIFSKDISFQKR